jgi:preprotein translocase subunit SecE
MVSHVKAESPKLVDKLLWGLVLAICIASISGNYYFTQYSLLMRVFGLLVCLGLAIGIASRTAMGQKIWQLWLGSTQEVRKIHWPTRQETVQTTLAVLAMVCVMGILLWTADFCLLRVVKWLTGHWGA